MKKDLKDWRLSNESVSSQPNPFVNDLGKFLVIVGLLIAAVGVLLWTGFGRGWLGRLPGDIHYKGNHFSFYFPIVTCLLLSLLLSLVLWLFRK